MTEVVPSSPKSGEGKSNSTKKTKNESQGSGSKARLIAIGRTP